MSNEANTVIVGDMLYTSAGTTKATKKNLSEMQAAVNSGAAYIANRRLMNARSEVSGKSWLRSNAKAQRYFAPSRAMGDAL